VKKQNLVAKHSRNKSGAGPHKSDKDYNRNNKGYQKCGNDLVQIRQDIDKLYRQQAITKNAAIWLQLQKEIDELRAEEAEYDNG
tara:strand:+ start:466 stop:717 length:252 start_codon:yes stop_codon:yes gene_type:complete